MRDSARFVTGSVALMLIAACGTAPRPIELQPLKTLAQHQQVMGQSDLGNHLKLAADAARAGDKASVLSHLRDARQSLGTNVMAAGNSMQPLAKHLDQAISQIDAADVNLREVSSILVSQLQDSVQASQHGQRQVMGQQGQQIQGQGAQR